MKKISILAVLVFLTACQTPIVAVGSDTLSRDFAPIDPNLAPRDLSWASFNTPTLNLRDTRFDQDLNTLTWSVQFQTSDFSEVFSLTLTKPHTPGETQWVLRNDHYVLDAGKPLPTSADDPLSHPDQDLSRIVLDTQDAEIKTLTKTFLKRMLKIVKDANNIGTLNEMLRELK